MKLYLVQHGKAKDEKEDPERPLSDAGIAETKKIADTLVFSGLVAVKKICHSGKLRARQTAEIFSGALLKGNGMIEMKGLKPMDDVSACAREINSWDEDAMIVGHQPHLSKLVSLLVSGNPDAKIAAFKFSGAICLEKQQDGSWAVAPLL